MYARITFVSVRSFVIGVLLLAAAVFSVPSAEALTISPVRLEIQADPGEVVVGEYRITNDTDSARTYFSVAENFRAQGETGVPQFVQEKTGLASWVSGPESITLQPFTTEVIPFEIAVPADAKPGGYFAAQFWASQPQVAAGGNTVGYRVGVLLLLRVAGEVFESGGLLDFAVDKTVTETTPLTFTYRFNNDGDDRLLPQGTVSIKNIFGREVATLPANPTEGNVLPVSIRQFELEWQEAEDFDPETASFLAMARQQLRPFHIGPYTAELTLQFGEGEVQVASASQRVWFVPTQLLVCVAVLLVGLLALYIVVRRGFRRAVARQAAELRDS